MKDLRELIELLKQYQVAEFDIDRGDMKVRLKFAQARGARDRNCRSRQACRSTLGRSGAGRTSRRRICFSCPSRRSRRRFAHRQISHRRYLLWLALTRSTSFCLTRRTSSKKRQVDLHRAEAMKLMNEIESDASGEIVKCFHLQQPANSNSVSPCSPFAKDKTARSWHLLAELAVLARCKRGLKP